MRFLLKSSVSFETVVVAQRHNSHSLSLLVLTVISGKEEPNFKESVLNRERAKIDEARIHNKRFTVRSVIDTRAKILKNKY